MPQSRTDAVSAARSLVEALPALIEQTASAGGPLGLASYALRTALLEAKRICGETNKPSRAVTSTLDPEHRPGG
ncbi:MAG: hypothetical protein ACRYGP_04165 [Janthinobacterium lividum]